MLLNRVWRCWGYGCRIECRMFVLKNGGELFLWIYIKAKYKTEKVSFAINGELTFLISSYFLLLTSYLCFFNDISLFSVMRLVI
jgi:hypothetical protein